MCALDQVAGANMEVHFIRTSWTVTEITSQIPFVPIKRAIPASGLQKMDVERRGIKDSAMA